MFILTRYLSKSVLVTSLAGIMVFVFLLITGNAMKDILGRDLVMKEVRRSAEDHIRDILDVTLEKIDMDALYDLPGVEKAGSGNP